MKLTEKELATVLAALRLWQRAMANPHLYLDHDDAEIRKVQYEGLSPLDDHEIDDFCERLSVDSPLSERTEVTPIIYEGAEQKYSLLAEKSGEEGIYNEMRVGVLDVEGQCVADALFTVSRETGEPRILITADGDGEGDHKMSVFPLRSLKKEAVELEGV